jgi:UDP-N-acetylmuramoyl-tripeptide--D-alanyl-D-alanine ligase
MFTILDIVKATGGELWRGDLKTRVKAVSTDTRKVKKGDLFIAIKGDKFDGHDFVADAIKSGATAVLVMNRELAFEGKAAVIVVHDTVKALGRLARYHRQRFKIPVIAITGSAGKTTTKEFIAAVLKKKFRVLYNAGTENNHIGVPMTLLKLRKTHQAAILELGTNHFGEISWLAQNTLPTVAVFTNIGPSHLAGLGSPQGVLKEKLTLIDCLAKSGSVILNADDPLLRTVLKRRIPQKVLTYAVEHRAEVKAATVGIKDGRLCFTLQNEDCFRLPAPVWGNVLNALAAIACGQLFKIKIKDVQEAIFSAKAAKGRQCFRSVGGVTIIDDTYNANPLSFKNALRTLALIPRKGRTFLLGADMLELGERTEELHAEVGLCVGESRVDKVLTIGRFARVIGEKAREVRPEIDARHFEKKEEMLNILRHEVRPGDVVLGKGSRGMHMEEVVNGLSDFLKRGA